MEKQARHERIERLFHAALALEPSERSDFLKRSCASDPALLAEVQSLISEHEQAGSFMKSPAYEIKADLLAAPEIRIGQTLDHYRVESEKVSSAQAKNGDKSPQENRGQSLQSPNSGICGLLVRIRGLW